jgi:hypothetical protein
MQAADRLIDRPKCEFLREQVHKVKGRLNDYAAIRTIELLHWQEARGMSGPVLEIGVFAGRYFSILLRSAIRTGSVAVGVDTFQWVPQPVRVFMGWRLAATMSASRAATAGSRQTNTIVPNRPPWRRSAPRPTWAIPQIKPGPATIAVQVTA